MKKSLIFGLFGLLLVMFVVGCQAENNTATTDIPEYSQDLVDWNMYSWEEDGEWVFSIVDRYAGYDSFEQISGQEFTLVGIDQLFSALAKLPANSEIFWSEYIVEGTVLPPDEVLYQVLNYTNSIGVSVVVLN